MIALFNAKPGDSLRDLRYTILCKKVSAAKSFDIRKTATYSLRHEISLSEVLYGGHRMGNWGWSCQDNSLIPVMLDSNPAPEALLKMIHCNCSTGCSSLRCRCSCRKQGLNCSQAYGRCQDDNCGHMKEGIASDDETEDEIEM